MVDEIFIALFTGGWTKEAGFTKKPTLRKTAPLTLNVSSPTEMLERLVHCQGPTGFVMDGTDPHHFVQIFLPYNFRNATPHPMLYPLVQAKGLAGVQLARRHLGVGASHFKVRQKTIEEPIRRFIGSNER